MKLSSDQALLGISGDRAALAKYFSDGGAAIPINIKGEITRTDLNGFFRVDVSRIEYKIPFKPEKPTSDVEAYIRDATLIVEATNYEQRNLVRDHRAWSQGGWLPTVGYVGDRPVCISLRNAYVDQRKVLFYEPTSAVVDHDLIKAWFEQALPNVRRITADNFPTMHPASAADAVWHEVGQVLAGTDHNQIDVHSRALIREAIERATGMTAP